MKIYFVSAFLITSLVQGMQQTLSDYEIKYKNYQLAQEAIEKRNNSTLQDLVINKQVVDNEQTLDSSLIGHALRARNNGALKILLDNGFDPNKGYWTYPLHLTASIGNVYAAKLLLEHGADINKQTHWERWTPLHYACERNNKPLIELLVKKGADTTLLNKDNAKPFDLTAEAILKKHEDELQQKLQEKVRKKKNKRKKKKKKTVNIQDNRSTIEFAQKNSDNNP